MIISYALQQFLFCGSEVHDRDRGAVCLGTATTAGMLFVMELMAFMMDARKDLPVDMGGEFPVPGNLWQEGTKACMVLPRWECSIAVSEVTARYGLS